MRRSITAIVTAILGLSTISTSTPAADIIVSSASVDASTSEFLISVMVRNGGPAPLGIAAFSLNLEITPTSPRWIEFDPTSQPDTLTDSSYLFFGNSASQADDIQPWTVTSNAGVNNEYTFTDVTEDTLDVNVAPEATILLASIRMKMGTGGFAPQVSDEFLVRIVGTGTQLINGEFGELSYEAFDGLVTVVPEPSTYALGAISTFVLAAAVRRRKKVTAGGV